MNGPKILVACLTDPSKGPRPKRMIDLCHDLGGSIDVLSPDPLTRKDGVRYLSLLGEYPEGLRDFRTKSGKLASMLLQSMLPGLKAKETVIGHGHGFWKFRKELSHQDYDLIIVEDLDLLPFAFSIKGMARILLDAREYYPRQRENSWLFQTFQAPYRTLFCKEYLARCDAVITVSPGLVEEYERVFGVRPKLIRSVPSAVQIQALPCEGPKIRLVHHGRANRNRQLEKMIEIFARLDSRFTLDLYLTGSRQLIKALEKRARNLSSLRILPPVSLSEIIPTLSNYDVGFYYLEPNGFNLKHSLPNKLFEFIQARLAVAIGPSPDMSQIVRQYTCGFVAPEFSIEAMAATLNSLTTGEINRAKAASDMAAKELCFEEERKMLEKILGKLVQESR
ncbi:MAG: glycosyltransferase [Oceanipulchritudo sp.]